MYFGAAYYPEHRDPFRWSSDLDLMREAHINVLRLGEFAWKRFEPREGNYDFSWMDSFIDQAWARGIQVMMCPAVRTAPAWLVEKDRTILIENADGIRLEFGSRYTFCINHPLLREKAFALAAQMARHWGSHPGVAGWHLDNEFNDEPDCHCPVCTAWWRQWLQARYGIIAPVNHAWGTVFWGQEYDRFSQIPTPRKTKTFHNPGLLQDWRQFRSDCTEELVGLHASIVRQNGAKQWITTNNQTWNPRTDYYDQARHVDIAGTNYYPPYGEKCLDIAHGLAACRSYKQKNFLVHELRCGPHAVPGSADNDPAPGEVTRLTFHTVANGADGIFYFAWKGFPFGAEEGHGSITDYDGRPTRIFKEVKEIGAALKLLSPMMDGTEVRSEVAVLYDFHTRWMTEVESRWVGRPFYFDHYSRIYRMARSLGLNVDVTGRSSDWSAYKVLVVPMLAPVDDMIVGKLKAFVAGGGVLVWHPFSGIKNMNAAIYTGRLHPVLQALFGVDVSDFSTAGDNETRAFTWNGRPYAGRLFFDLPVLKGAEVLGSFSEGWFAGTPAILEKTEGRGRGLYVATFAEDAFYADFLSSVCDQAGVGRILGKGVPIAFEVAQRTAADGRRLVFVMNSTGRSQTMSLPDAMEDLLSQEVLSGQIQFAPWGVRVLRPTEQPTRRNQSNADGDSSINRVRR